MKFVKWLEPHFESIVVVRAQYQEGVPTDWAEDLKALTKTTFREVSTKWPTVFPSKASNLRDRLVFHFEKRLCSLIKSGAFMEDDVYCESSIRETVRALVDEGYTHFVVSAGPFRTAFYVVDELNKLWERPFVVLDLRDPWSSNKLSFMRGVSLRRIEYEVALEARTLSRVNAVVVAHQPMVQETVEFGISEKQVHWIPNGFEVEHPTPSLVNGSKLIKMFFPGTIYSGACEHFVEFLEKSRSIVERLEIRFELDIAGDQSTSIRERLSRFSEVTFIGRIPNSEVIKRLIDANIAVSFVSPLLPYALNTKIVEALGLSTPVILLSDVGWVSNWLTETGMGVSLARGFDQNQLAEAIAKLINDEPWGPWNERDDFRVSDLSQRYLSILNSSGGS